MCLKSFTQCLLLFLFATPLFGQSNYFARDYPTFTDQLATEVFFHPNGGYSVVFGGLSGSKATTLHRMDAAGNIGLSYTSNNSNHLHFNLDLDTAGNHWLVSQPLQVINAGNSSDFDSVMVTYLDDNLQLIWETGFDIGLSVNEVALSTGLKSAGDHLYVIGQVYDYDLPGDPRDGIFIVKVNANGQKEWSKRYYQLSNRWVIPHHILELQNGNIALNGSIREPYFIADSWLWLLDNNGDSLMYTLGGTNDYLTGNIVENASGDISYISTFYHSDGPYEFLYTNLHVFNPTSQTMVTSAISTDKKGEQLIQVGGVNYTLLDKHTGLKLYSSAGGSFDVYHPNLTTNRHHTTSYGLQGLPPKASNLSYDPATGNLLIGMGYRTAAGVKFPILMLTDLGGITEIEEEEELQNEWVCYPNPSTGQFTIHKVREGTQTYSGRVHDLQGRILHSFVFNGTEEIDLSYLANGCYFLQLVHSDEVIHTEKILIQH